MNMDKRQKGFESKFAHDEEMLFKANARRAKLVGLWAAEKMGLTSDEAAEYEALADAADFISILKIKARQHLGPICTRPG